MPDKYFIGECLICHRYKALRNGVCSDCKKQMEPPDFLNDLFDKGE